MILSHDWEHNNNVLRELSDVVGTPNTQEGTRLVGDPSLVGRSLSFDADSPGFADGELLSWYSLCRHSMHAGDVDLLRP